MFVAAQSPSGAYNSPAQGGTVTAAAVGAACGATTQVLFNSVGSCAGSAAFTYDGLHFVTVGDSAGSSGVCIKGGSGACSVGFAALQITAQGGANAGRISFENASSNNSNTIQTDASDNFLYTANGVAGGGFMGPAYKTTTNCSSSASPAVCGSAAAGMFVLPAAATSVTVNTTAVTANSEIIVFNDDSLGTRLSVTCNTSIDNVLVSARVAATSFTITGSAPVTNPNCYSYLIVN